MASITVSLEGSFKERLELFPWVNWSEVGREEVLKREIFERYRQTGRLTEEDRKFCESIDWHPVDELPLKEEFVAELKKAQKGPHRKMTLEKLDGLLGLK